MWFQGAGRSRCLSNPTKPVSNITRDIRWRRSPEGKSSLSEAVKIGQTPSGKAMRFEHQGSVDADIDATYDAITAYLDEKGVDAQDFFIEEYANDVKDADDPTLQVNIYVLLN